jgi:phosphatidylglycerol:prolipoprotein diacylglycerol transferase
MHPILLELGPLKIPAYGFFLAIAFLACNWLARWIARQEKFDPELVTRAAGEFIVAALLGAHLSHVLMDWRIYVHNPGRAFIPGAVPLAFQGGLAAAVVVGWWFCRRHKIRPGQLFDIVVPTVPLGLAFARVGCFLAGCCYGEPCHLPWAVTFPHLAGARHPAQLYELVLDLGLLVFMLWYRKRKRFEGEMFFVFLLLYGIIRFACECVRADTPADLWGLSWPQWVSMGFIYLGSFVLIRGNLKT